MGDGRGGSLEGVEVLRGRGVPVECGAELIRHRLEENLNPVLDPVRELLEFRAALRSHLHAEFVETTL